MNPVDVGVVRGVFHAMGLVDQPDHTGLGCDFAGTVVAAGPGVDVPIGARVAGVVDRFDRNFGTHAEQVVAAGDRSGRRRRRVRRRARARAQVEGHRPGQGGRRAVRGRSRRLVHHPGATGLGPVVDGAAMQEQALALAADGGRFVGVELAAPLPEQRGIIVDVVVAHPDAARLTDLLARTAAGELPSRVHAVVPLDRIADANRAVSEGGFRGRYVVQP